MIIKDGGGGLCGRPRPGAPHPQWTFAHFLPSLVLVTGQAISSSLTATIASPCSDLASSTPSESLAVDSSRDWASPSEMTSARTRSPGLKELMMETCLIAFVVEGRRRNVR